MHVRAERDLGMREYAGSRGQPLVARQRGNQREAAAERVRAGAAQAHAEFFASLERRHERTANIFGRGGARVAYAAVQFDAGLDVLGLDELRLRKKLHQRLDAVHQVERRRIE